MDDRKLQAPGGWFLSALPPWAAGLLRNLVLGIIGAALLVLSEATVSLPPDSPVWLAGVLAVVIALLRAGEGWFDARKADGWKGLNHADCYRRSGTLMLFPVAGNAQALGIVATCCRAARYTGGVVARPFVLHTTRAHRNQGCVRPMITTNDGIHVASSDTVFIGNFLSRNITTGVAGTNRGDISSTELCQWVSITTGHSSLSSHVGVIVGSCSKEQMIGINARRDITVMQDTQILRDRSVVQFPRKPVRQHMRPVSPAYTNSAVSATVSRSGPKPATIGARLIDLFPKAVCNGARLDRRNTNAVDSKAGAGTETPVALLYTIAIHLKRIAAHFTGSRNDVSRGRIHMHTLGLLNRSGGAMPWSVSALPGLNRVSILPCISAKGVT